MLTRLRQWTLSITIATLIGVIGTAHADDTDVYLNPGAGLPANSEPMVMFSLDYRPNLGSSACNGSECDTLIAEGYMSAAGPYTFFDVLRGALRKVFDPLEGVRVGLMLNHYNNNNCAGYGRTNCSNGGYVAMGFEDFVAGDGNGAKARFHGILEKMPIPLGNTSHSYQGKELFFEFFRYLTGQNVYNAHNGYSDYGTSPVSNLNVDNPALAWDSGIEVGPTARRVYESPLSEVGACSKLYSVNMMFQVSNQEDDSDGAIKASVSSGGFGSAQREFPDVIQYLHDADLSNGDYGTAGDLDDKQNVVSYFIVDETKINTTTRAYARAGGTGVPLALNENPDDLVRTLQEVFKQIKSVSTTFVAASVPVNVFNQAEITDNVFIALFQVDGQGRPYWTGNVKKLKLTGVNDPATPVTLVDANGVTAIASDGRIRFDALTSWTEAMSLPSPDTDAGEVAGRDGRVVSRGGAGQKVPGVMSGSPQESNGLSGRRIYYDRTPTSLGGLNVDSLTAMALQADLGAESAAEALDLIAYARGLDVDDLDGDSDTYESRDWIFGDALHSRPLPINYGNISGHSDPENPAIFIAVATNDGMLRMIRNTTSAGIESGTEVWAFMPRASMSAQRTLRANGVGMKHPYTIDGAPVTFIQDLNHDGSIDVSDGDRVYLYIGMRRGGKAYYAFDITDPETPDLMWTIDKSGDFEELGFTFSSPRVGLVRTSSGARSVIMFAGGYDLNKDTRGSVGSDDSEGNALYVVDAKTGQLIWKARGGSGSSGGNVFVHPNLVDSIPSSLSVVDSDGDGFTDRMVVGDTGGNIWRADIQGSDIANWKLTQMASLGRHYSGAAGVATDRRFFHRPDIVQGKDSNGLFDAVVIGSGNRANPLDSGGMTENYTYVIKDRQTAAGSGVDAGLQHGDFGDVTSNCLQSSDGCSVNLENGWQMHMQEPGEKVLATPLTISGKIFFTSYLPQSGSGATACAPSEGAGRLYAVALQDGTAVINYDTSDDDPDFPDQPTSANDRSVELQSLGIPAEVVYIPANKILRPDLVIDDIDVTMRWPTYWHMQEDSDL